MKKIALIAFLLTVCVTAGRAQESRQDVSLSGSALVEPFVGSSTDVYVHANPAYGLLASYRFMLTPSSAIEGNFGITDHNVIGYDHDSDRFNKVNTRNEEISFAYVRSFNFRKYNPFVEAGPGIFLFSPIHDKNTTILDTKRQTEFGLVYGAGVAYEISPSFDIRVEYRGLFTKVPNFGLTGVPANLTTNKWYNIYNPVIGAAYHF
jgi:opacity protein-like surface antigen